MKSDTDIHTAASVHSLQPHPVVLEPKSLVAGSSSHSPATWPLAPPVGTIQPAPAVDSACNPLVRYDSGVPKPFHLPHPSPCGPDSQLAVDDVHFFSPSLSGLSEVMQLPEPPADPPDHCLTSKLEIPNCFPVNMGHSSFEWASVSSPLIFDQTKAPIVAALKSSCVNTGGSSTIGHSSPL